MALAPYWLMPTLCPFPVPVITNWLPPEEPEEPEALSVTVPEEVTALWVPSCREESVPLPEIV